MTKEQRKLEKAIRTIYNNASKAINAKIIDKAAMFNKADLLWKKQLAEGQITKAIYTQWLRQELLFSPWSKEISTFINGELYNASKTVSKLVNAERLTAYAFGFNLGLYEIEKSIKAVTSLNLISTETVNYLLNENPKLLPQAREYLWGNRRIQSALTQSVLEGDGVKGLTRRLTLTTAMEKGDAIRNARTVLTACQNAGRQQVAEEAEDMGVNVKKMWISTLDERTRSSHAEMDGVKRDVDEPFLLTNRDGSESELMFPGDPDGAPEQIYNCRCTMGYVVDDNIDNISPEVIERRTKIEGYNEWRNKR